MRDFKYRTQAIHNESLGGIQAVIQLILDDPKNEYVRLDLFSKSLGFYDALIIWKENKEA